MSEFKMYITMFIQQLIYYISGKIWSDDYYVSFKERYSTFAGFLIGALIIVFIFGASYEKNKKKSRIIVDVLKLFATIALINASDGLYIGYQNIINNLMLESSSLTYVNVIQGTFNPLSLLILVLVVSEVFKNKFSKAFFFALGTFSISTFMFYGYYLDKFYLIFLILRIVLMALVCALLSILAYKSFSYIIIGIYYIITEAIQSYFIILMDSNYSFNIDEFWREIISILSSYKAEYIFMAFSILLFFFYEFVIIKENKTATIKKLFKYNFVRIASVAIIVVILPLLILATSNNFMKKMDWDYYVLEAAAAEEENIEYIYEETIVSKVEASSYLISRQGTEYGPEFTIDKSIGTCWQDGQEGDGTGETLTYYFDSPLILKEIFIINGRAVSEDRYIENNRLAKANIHFYMDEELLATQTISIKDEFSQEGILFITEQNLVCNKVTFEIVDIHNGSKYQDLCITEIFFRHIVEQ